LNLSLGSDSSQSYKLSPLNYAVERAWKAGITVVVSAGNSGPGARTVLKPADDPYVVTVGSSNDEGTLPSWDDQVPVFSSRGPTRADGLAKPDLVAPGVHTISLRSPGSAIDQQFGSTAVVKNDYFRGTGTSMSTATVTGVVAQIVQANPSLVPDQVKARLTGTTQRMATTDKYAAGAGNVDAYRATRSTSTARANQYGLLFASGLGLGSLQADRGSIQLTATTPLGSADLSGEVTALHDDSFLGLNVLGLAPWVSATYTLAGWDPTTWNLTQWLKYDWTSMSWKSMSWKVTTWDSMSWKGTEWRNADWDSMSWKDANWDSMSWKASNWQTAWYAAAWD